MGLPLHIIEMIVCIAEKPSVARDIAKVLGANTAHEGYMEGNGYQVTWTFGHLCTLKEPHDYTDQWKAWALSRLPMVPPRFGIKLIADKGVEKQFKVIASLFQKADSIVNCGDVQSPSVVILEPRKIKSDTVSPSICHEVMGLDAMILVF